MPLGRQREKAQRQGEGHTLLAPSQADSSQIDMGLLRPDHNAGHDGLSGPNRKPHEPRPEALQLICLQTRLETPLLAFGKQQEQLFAFEHFKRIGMRGLDAAEFARDVSKHRGKIKMLPICQNAGHPPA
jgi:hypothetical protein